MKVAPKPPKRVGYILYVDESGDDGFETVYPLDPHGASEWMILGGVLVHARNYLRPIEWVREFKQTIKGSHQRPDLHFADLTDPQRLDACTHIASKHLRWFAVCAGIATHEPKSTTLVTHFTIGYCAYS